VFGIRKNVKKEEIDQAIAMRKDEVTDTSLSTKKLLKKAVSK